MKAAVLGSTGYAGMNLVKILLGHPNVELEFLGTDSFVGMNYDQIYRQLKGLTNLMCLKNEDVFKREDLEIVFLALPHGVSMNYIKKLMKMNVKIIDLSGDFRIKDKNVYEMWYGVSHKATDELSNAVFGLPEVYKSYPTNTKFISNPGCYPTAAILALAPLAHNGLIVRDSIIIDAKSGVSGAGKSATVGNLYCENNENLKAYNPVFHKHIPEIEQELNRLSDVGKIQFVPTLVPMQSGILENIYLCLTKVLTEANIFEIYREYYKDSKFVRVSDNLPETKFVTNTNFCDISLRYDKRTNRLIVFSALDNLIKGAAGQAVQNMNILMGIDEETGLI